MPLYHLKNFSTLISLTWRVFALWNSSSHSSILFTFYSHMKYTCTIFIKIMYTVTKEGGIQINVAHDNPSLISFVRLCSYCFLHCRFLLKLDLCRSTMLLGFEKSALKSLIVSCVLLLRSITWNTIMISC